MANTALIVLDFINDIVSKDGKISASAQYVEENQIIDKANQVIDYARRNHFLLIFVKVGFDSSYKDCSSVSPLFSQVKSKGALQLGTHGTEFHPSLKIKDNDLVIIKHRVSAYYKTNLDAILQKNKIDTVMLIGVSSDMAVQSTARESHDRDYKVIVIEDACATQNKELNDNVMNMLGRIAEIKKTSDLK